MTKILLYRGGKPGVVATLPGGHPPEVEISDLLGGEVTVTPLTKGLTLATLADAPRLRLPFQYVATSIIPSAIPPEPEPVPGDAVIYAVAGDDAHIVDITDADRGLILAEGLMTPLEFRA